MALLAATAAAATAACLDSALGFSTDIAQMRNDAAFARRLEKHIQRLGDRVTLYHLLEFADQNADALWFEGRSWNYRAMKSEVDRLAKGLQQLGVSAGDFIAVYMTNSPEMLFMIYAISKLGAAPALLNAALRDDTLVHCLKIAQSKLMICTPDLLQFASTASQANQDDFDCYYINLGSFHAFKATDIDGVHVFPYSSSKLTDRLPEISVKRSVADIAALLYTSGTTDVKDPKKYFPLRTYSCMPLFHGTTFLTGLCYSLGTSGTFCLARRFSASKFWQDVVESRTTRMLYVGELCRYLCASPSSKYDRAHNCIVATGNGLQKDVWTLFKKRFGVPEIREYYRSTEGLAKYDNRNLGSSGTGKVGYSGLVRRSIEDDVFIVKFDFENERPFRDEKTGFCQLAALGEPGEAIGRVRSLATYTDYLGNREATEAKMLRDVFKKGDIFQRSGDLLVHERLGWIRFHDRIGDTYRWKGENISAGEVSGLICEIDNAQDCIIVGKALSGYDGQAGVAAITLKSSESGMEEQFMKNLHTELKKKGIPAYAFPRLVTITTDIAINATFKHAKQALKAMNWNPDDRKSGNSMYWLDGTQYKPLTIESWSSIECGSAKL